MLGGLWLSLLFLGCGGLHFDVHLGELLDQLEHEGIGDPAWRLFLRDGTIWDIGERLDAHHVKELVFVVAESADEA